VATQIDSIEHLVLLDLLGAEKPIIQSYYSSTAWLFDGLSAAEHRMGLLGLFNEVGGSNAEGGEWHPWSSFFKPRTSYEQHWGGIQDDHIPFVQRGVNILHVITNPFPKVWHTIKVSKCIVNKALCRRIIQGRCERNSHTNLEEMESDLQSIHC
jgi:hypothetical protein